MRMSAAGGGATARAGSAAPTAGAGGSFAAAGSSGAASSMPHEDLGKGDGSDVITIGDSWMSNTLGTGDAIQGAMQRLTMQPYRHYAVQGVMLLSASGFGPAIPSQYDTAKRVNPNIKTVLITAGGNDIIQNASVQASCNEGGQECLDLLNKISDTLNELWTKMAADGVKDVVYIRYSKDAGTTSDKVRDMQKPIEICLSGKIRCHAIDSTEAVMAELQDGIHPTRAANDRLAKVIWDVMEKEGVRR
jgi:lysophospholipase L1-like esterase